ncbi:MAG TPA: aminotransferase class IV [Agrococcus sp.]|nr:aminotransferase class IV [Agrococcus sp.]
MSGTDAVRAWTGMAFERVDAPVSRTLAADSWLVDDGAVLALDRHRLRFADAVADAGGDRLDALTAARHATGEVPHEGRWSPRLDLTPEGIRLRVRPAPEPSMHVEVVTASRDPRTLPQRKGPDLAALGELQEEEGARVGAAVEPVITVDGLLAESTWSALLWWRGDALCVPAAAIPRLPSVTAAVIAELARIDGVELRQERAAPDDLEGCEVWLANALRGIRAVSAWIDGPRVAPAVHAGAWQARLDGLRTVPAASRR